MKTEAEYKALNDRFDARMKLLHSKYKRVARELPIYTFKDGLLQIELTGSEIMHDSDQVFKYKLAFHFKLPFER